MDITQIGQSVDSRFRNLNKHFNPTANKSNTTWAYGRGLEQASGLALWFVAYTFLFGVDYGISSETITINNGLWAYLAVVLGLCQIYYNGLVQRKMFNLVACAAWLTISMTAYIQVGGWNMITAISLPYTLIVFYMYGFLVGEDIKKSSSN